MNQKSEIKSLKPIDGKDKIHRDGYAKTNQPKIDEQIK
jgi:hypothetical protein